MNRCMTCGCDMSPSAPDAYHCDSWCQQLAALQEAAWPTIGGREKYYRGIDA